MKHRLSILLLGFLFAGTFAFAQEGNNTPNPDENDIIVQDFLDKANRIDVYPNPAQESTFLKLQTTRTGDFMVRVFDVSGKEVLMNSFFKDQEIMEHKLNVSNLPTGVYTIQLINDDAVAIKQFVKQ